jgi:glutamate synthase domain-containing protein 1
MCGIAGFFYKNGASEVPLGTRLSDMATVLGSRGLDSTGMALYGDLPADHLALRVHLDSASGDTEARLAEIRERVGEVATVASAQYSGNIARIELEGIADTGDLEHMTSITHAVESAGVELFSIGNAMEIVKDVGPASELAVYDVGAFSGTHGIAHTRLATESRVDICYSHPFWARPFPDIAVVHNGQLTNDNKMRRSFQRRGYEFLTTNDSEVIAVFIADRLRAGASLEEALTDSIEVLDGTFTYLVATRKGIGFAKDRFSTKPLIIAEDEGFVAMASEEVALAPVMTATTKVHEPTARTVRTWHR